MYVEISIWRQYVLICWIIPDSVTHPETNSTSKVLTQIVVVESEINGINSNLGYNNKIFSKSDLLRLDVNFDSCFTLSIKPLHLLSKKRNCNSSWSLSGDKSAIEIKLVNVVITSPEVV